MDIWIFTYILNIFVLYFLNKFGIILYYWTLPQLTVHCIRGIIHSSFSPLTTGNYEKENMNMKKIIAMLLTVAMIGCLFAGCGAAKTEDNVDYSSMTIEELKPLIKTINQGKLTMVTSPDFAPYEFYSLDENGTPTLAGFDIALGYYIAEFLGLELEIIPMDFDGTISELAAGKADIGMAGYSPDPDRENAMDFSAVYYTGGQSFVCHMDNEGAFAALIDANKPEFQIGAQIGSIQADLAKEHTPDADIVELSKVTDIIAEVIAGKLDGAFIETVVAETYAKNYPELCVVLPVPYEAEGSVVGVKDGNAALLAAVNLAIEAALADGSMSQFVADANAAASGNTYEGLLGEDGAVPTEG